MKSITAFLVLPCLAVLCLLIASPPVGAQNCDRMAHGTLCITEFSRARAVETQQLERLFGSRSHSCAGVECEFGQLCLLGQCYFPEDRCDPRAVQCPMGMMCYMGACYPAASTRGDEVVAIQCGVPSRPEFACDTGYVCVDQQCISEQAVDRVLERERYASGTSSGLVTSRCPEGTVQVAENACITPDEGPCRGCEPGQICFWGRCFTPVKADACSGMRCPPRTSCQHGVCVPSRG